MGKSITPKYRMEIQEKTTWEHLAWNGAKPTDENLKKQVHVYAKSLEIGGANEHISLGIGYIPYPVVARIIEQRTGNVVAFWKAGLFQIW